jgi:hypothetical protein
MRPFHLSDDPDLTVFHPRPLWNLHGAVRTSSLVFSLIRMRNAAPR